MTRRPRSAVALAVVASLLAAACGGDEDRTARGDERCPFDALDQAEGVVEIDLWHTEAGMNAIALDAIVAAYHESQDAVRVRPQFQGTFQEQLRKYEDAMADPASLPDIVSPDDTVTRFMADSGTVIAVQECIDADPEAPEIYDDLVPIVTAAYSIDDVLWPGAYAAAGAATFVNEDHLEAAGLDPETDLPETLDELRAVAEAIAAADIPGVEAPLVMRIDAWPLEFLTSGAREPVVDMDNGRTGLATESLYANDVTLEILDWLAGMHADGLLKYTDHADVITPFLAMATESSSILIDSSSAIRTVDGAIQGTLTADQVGLDDDLDLSGFSVPDLRITVGELPGLSEPGRGQMGGAAWYLVDGADPVRIAAAWDFMKFFNQTDQQVTWAIEGSSFPVRRAAAEDPRLQAYWTETASGRWMAEAYRGFTTLDPDFPGPVIGPYRQFREAVKNGVERIILSGADPAATMAEVDSQIQAELDAYADEVAG